MPARESTVDKKNTNLTLGAIINPSVHCVATVITKEQSKLLTPSEYSAFLRGLLEKEEVQCVGEVSKSFNNDSFTTVTALSESHISVHTWPERFSVQLDVFLCNYMNDNTDKCKRIFESIIKYFDPQEVQREYIDRL